MYTYYTILIRFVYNYLCNYLILLAQEILTDCNQYFFSIGVVERGTGIGRHRLRVWERRYGFPGPEGNAKGERSYPEEQLQRPQRTRRLLDRGMRPGKLLPESSEQLNKTVEAVLDAVCYADNGQVEAPLRRQYEKRSMQKFVLETTIPLL